MDLNSVMGILKGYVTGISQIVGLNYVKLVTVEGNLPLHNIIFEYLKKDITVILKEKTTKPRPSIFLKTSGNENSRCNPFSSSSSIAIHT